MFPWSGIWNFCEGTGNFSAKTGQRDLGTRVWHAASKPNVKVAQPPRLLRS
jgi:hypothetical protein